MTMGKVSIRRSLLLILVSLPTQGIGIDHLIQKSPGNRADINAAPTTISHSLGQRTRSINRLNLMDIASLGRNELWAVGDEKDAVISKENTTSLSSTAVLLVSRDGGLSWNKQYSQPNTIFYRIYRPSPDIFWILGHDSLAIKSTDGGNSWSKKNAPIKFNPIDIQFIDANTGWILDINGKILRTKDGGETWSYHYIGSKRYVSSFQFNSDIDGWATCEYGRLYQSTDGGSSWNDRTASFNINGMSSAEKDLVFSAVKAINTNEIFLFAEVRPKRTMIAEETIIFHSTDNAKTWAMNKLSRADGVFGVHFINEREAWLVPRVRGVESLLHTMDGWKTWKEIKLPAGNPRKLHFFNSNLGWFIAHTDDFSSDTLFCTQDRGKTWNQLKVQID